MSLHVSNMMKTLRANRELQKGARNLYRSGKDKNYIADGHGKSENPLDQLKGEELAAARKKVQERLAIQKRKQLIKTGIISAVVIALAVWLILWLFT